jgi:galactonate dehydratase
MMYNAGLGYKGGPVKMSAISGIDMALWDIAGKAVGLPVYKMLGGACRDRVRVYRAVHGRLPYCVEPGQAHRDGKPKRELPNEPATYAEAAHELVQEWGFRCLKAHFHAEPGIQGTSKIDGIVERFAAIREGVGAGVDVAVDIHNPHPSVAKQLIEALAPFRPLFVEEPMPIERVDALLDVARTTNVAIAAGERWMGKWVFFDAVRDGSLSVLQPDISHAGGITEIRKIAAIGEAAYAQVAMHCPLSPVAFAAAIQLDAYLPNFLVQEHNEVNDWREGSKTYIGKGYLREPFVLDDEGYVAIPEGPGLGIELDEAGLEQVNGYPWSERRG